MKLLDTPPGNAAIKLAQHVTKQYAEQIAAIYRDWTDSVDIRSCLPTLMRAI